jgi:hypothetical protein
MLIKPKTKEEIRQAMESGKAREIFRLVEEKIILQEKKIEPSSPTHKLVPLTDENGNVLHFRVWEAINKCIEERKIPASLKDAQEYIRKNKGLYWTGTLIAYPEEGANENGKIAYNDYIDEMKYIISLPKKIKITGEQAIILPFNFFEDGTPYFEKIETKINGANARIIKINNEDELIERNILAIIQLPKKQGRYIIDQQLFIPNGPKAESNGPDSQFLHIIASQPYIGFVFFYNANIANNRNHCFVNQTHCARGKMLIYD